MRRFLEHWGESIDRVILCVMKDSHLRIYKNIVKLYFPRTQEEVNTALEELPRDTGNKYGETVIENRMIRIKRRLRDSEYNSEFFLTGSSPRFYRSRQYG